MNYQEFLERKLKTNKLSGFDIHEDYLNKNLFDFQKYIVRKALSIGKFAIFAECGLGKTIMQLEWAHQVSINTGQAVLILCPLAVSSQTIEEGRKFGIEVNRYNQRGDAWLNTPLIYISNYEQIENIDCSVFAGIILDESSILKNFAGATKQKIIDSFASTPYKLCCTATPSPNDDMEICNHAEFLGHGRREEILAMYFTHDGGETAKWRLKGHARKMFWNFVKSWALMVSNPSDIQFDGSKFILPKLNLIERFIKTPTKQGKLFNDVSISATNFNQELRDTMKYRLQEVKDIIESTNENVIIWIKQNKEAEKLLEMIPDAIEINGSDSLERKEFVISWFTNPNNECLCDIKGVRKNTNLNIGKNIIQKTRNQFLKGQDQILKKRENTIPNGENQNLNTINNTITAIKSDSKNIEKRLKITGTKEGEKDMLLIKSIEKNANQIQSILIKEIRQQGSKDYSELITESQSNNIMNGLQNKMEVVPSVEQNIPIDQNNDCLLITRMNQKKSEDYFVQNVISESEISMIQKYCSNVPLCTCGKHKRKVIISKAKIMQFGINAQNCHNQIFASLDFSFESLYQAIRRSYRFGQKHEVNIYLITTDTMKNVIHAIQKKQEQFSAMKTYLINN